MGRFNFFSILIVMKFYILFNLDLFTLCMHEIIPINVDTYELFKEIVIINLSVIVVFCYLYN